MLRGTLKLSHTGNSMDELIKKVQIAISNLYKTEDLVDLSKFNIEANVEESDSTDYRYEGTFYVKLANISDLDK
jgi:hypothetical protein